MVLRALCLFTLLSGLTSIALSQTPPPLAAPGLPIPGGALPYALDHFQGKPQLVPVHHTPVAVNNHKGANLAGSLAGSFFYKPKMTVEVAGVHARTILHDPAPSFYIHVGEDPDGSESALDQSSVFAIVQAIPDKDRRVFAQVRFTQITGNAKRNDGIVESRTERLPGGWLQITPSASLSPGEYALNPIPKAQNTFSTVVFDFTIDPVAPNSTDAVQAAP